jgi:hypothetical protein
LRHSDSVRSLGARATRTRTDTGARTPVSRETQPQLPFRVVQLATYESHRLRGPAPGLRLDTPPQRSAVTPAHRLVARPLVTHRSGIAKEPPRESARHRASREDCACSGAPALSLASRFRRSAAVGGLARADGSHVHVPRAWGNTPPSVRAHEVSRRGWFGWPTQVSPAPARRSDLGRRRSSATSNTAAPPPVSVRCARVERYETVCSAKRVSCSGSTTHRGRLASDRAAVVRNR